MLSEKRMEKWLDERIGEICDVYFFTGYTHDGKLVKLMRAATGKDVDVLRDRVGDAHCELVLDSDREDCFEEDGD